MPFYPGASGATTPTAQVPSSIYAGGWAYLFGVPTISNEPPGDSNISGETPTAGEASVAVALAPAMIGSIVRNVGVQLLFSANPGAFNIQVQEADTDADGFYLTPAAAAYTITAATEIGSTGKYVARADLGAIGSQFIRLFCDANPNAVSIVAKVVLQ
jgi:hypothetical protein